MRSSVKTKIGQMTPECPHFYQCVIYMYALNPILTEILAIFSLQKNIKNLPKFGLYLKNYKRQRKTEKTLPKEQDEIYSTIKFEGPITIVNIFFEKLSKK